MLELFAAAALAVAPVTECDRLAAHPSDPDRVAPGVAQPDVDLAKAIPACQAAVKAYPDSGRLNYQLARSLGYAGRGREAGPNPSGRQPPRPTCGLAITESERALPGIVDQLEVELAKLGINDNERGRAMLSQARCLANAGQKEKAIAVYQAIQRLPVVDQNIIATAGVNMGELTASTPSTPTP